MSNPIIYWQAPDTKDKIIEALKSNKVLITTTDTIPGLLANTTNQGFQELNKIKQDRQNKPYIILIGDSSIGDSSKLDHFGDISKLDHFVEPEQLTPQIRKLVKHCWPGPLTIIFKAKKDLPNFLKSEQGTIAIRCPNYAPLLEILKHFEGLYSTSANRSAGTVPATIDSVDQQLALEVAYLVDDSDSVQPVRQSYLSGGGVATTDKKEQMATDKLSLWGKPSTIIDISNMHISGIGQTDKIRVIRHGAYSIKDLEKILDTTVSIEKNNEKSRK
jgi:L-threonylcarbamoyladenylate synthase